MKRELARRLLRPLPAPLLARAGRREDAVGRLARQGLRRRTVTVAAGVATGLRINPGMSNPQYALGTNELPVQLALASHLGPGAVVYDVGANIGFMTMVAALLVGPAGMVVAFEPDAANAAAIRANATANGFGNVLVTMRAAGSATGIEVLQESAYSGGHALVGAEPPPDLLRHVPVEVVSLDDFAAQPRARQPDLVKIDVEGFELGVLAGMRRLLTTKRPTLLVEVDDGDVAAHDRKAGGVRDALSEFGYHGTRLEDSYAPGGWTVSHWVFEPSRPALNGVHDHAVEAPR